MSEATVKLHAEGARIIATAEGNGPVNALDVALRIVGEIERTLPSLRGVPGVPNASAVP